MNRFTSDQLAVAASKGRYMARDESIEFLDTLGIRMSVGHWSAGDFCDRFANFELDCWHTGDVIGCSQKVNEAEFGEHLSSTRR